MDTLKADEPVGPSSSNSSSAERVLIKTEPIDFEYRSDSMECNSSNVMYTVTAESGTSTSLEKEPLIKTESNFITPDVIQLKESLATKPDRKMNVANHTLMISAASKLGMFQCKHCKFKSKRFLQLKYHEWRHFWLSRYKREQLNNVRQIQRTNKPKRCVFKLFKCRQCYFSCRTSWLLFYHEKCHLEMRSLECDQCDYAAVRSGNLKFHKSKHTGDTLYKCNKCNYSTTSSGYLTNHYLKHAIDYATSKSSSLIKSDSPTARKLLKCDLCDFSTTKYYSLKTHKVQHANVAQFKCDQCDYCCAVKASLKTHQFRHTGEKPFKCDQCDYSAATKGQLKTHVLKHTGEKPFKCDQCDYACTTSANLHSHKKTHSGENTFKCDKCDFRSVLKTHLKKHQLKHLGEKPFKCEK